MLKAMGLMATIRLEGIRKSYGANTVLHGLSLEVPHGECFTLLGPSGCGKTVLLRLIAGFEKPDAGSIRVGERRVSDTASSAHVPPNERGLGVVFQDYAVWPHMNVFDNIAYPLKLAGVDGRDLRARVMESVEQVNLGGLESRLPSELSGGQQQRVALARALVARPALLLLDEPLCNLDANLREEMRFEIRELQRSIGITILYVTHDQEIALAISDRMAIMDENGSIRQVGRPAEIFEQPADRYVFRFIGLANFLPVQRVAGVLCVAGSDQPFSWEPPGGDGPRWLAGFRPSDVRISRAGIGLACRVKRASFLGAMMDYLIEVDGSLFRAQVETHEAIAQGLVLREAEPCRAVFHNIHWFEDRDAREGRQEDR
jgi:iron(III) transport system ATP-binding protein